MMSLTAILNYLREFNIASVFFRLFLATLFGGMIGYERGKKGRAAGFRTYMFVCMGAALTILLSQYEYILLHTRWADIAEAVGANTDTSRFGAQVINGIGFLGAGTIIVVRQQQVKGLTTAAALWASACVGLAIGAGFYEGVLLAFILIAFCVTALPRLEATIVENTLEIILYIEFKSLNNVGEIITRIKRGLKAQIYDIEINRDQISSGKNPSAVVTLHMPIRTPHSRIISFIAELECITMIKEL